MRKTSGIRIALLFILQTAILILFNCSTDNDFPDLSGSYLGQIPPPVESAEIFAPGIISTGVYTRDITMTPDGDELYFCIVLGNYNYTSILGTKLINGKWTEPQAVSFITEPEYMYIEPHLSASGNKFFFVSNKHTGDPNSIDSDIWIADRTDTGWGKPYNPGEPLNTGVKEYFPSVTENGTLYFTRAGADNISYICRSKLVDGKYSEPERLPDNINIPRGVYNAYIFPDESCLLYCIYGNPGGYGMADYYISFRDENDNWSDPVNAGPRINSAANAVSASLSPDGKYLFFVSSEFKIPDGFGEGKLFLYDIQSYANSVYNGSANVMWIKSDFIKDLRN